VSESVENLPVLAVARSGGIARPRGCRAALERLVADQLRDFGPDAPARWRVDRCLFYGERLAAVIRANADGRPSVVRFDV
jgi:hypothetical protein